MRKFVISDTHFGHNKIVKYLNRPFMNKYEQEIVNNREISGDHYDEYLNLKISEETINRMNETIIDNINRMVGKNDILFHLGDVSFGDPRPFLDRINCKNVHLIIGNHDYRYKSKLEECFKSIGEIEITRSGNQQFIMCHYPMLSWPFKEKGSIMVCGHCHNKTQYGRDTMRFDAGVDCNGFAPVLLDDIIEYFGRKPNLS